MPTTRALTLGTLLGVALALVAALPAPARGQVEVTAAVNQSCAGTRARRNLGCSSNDFTTSATFSQAGVVSCALGDVISLDVVTTIVSHSPTRYDGAVFLGERGNDPSRNDASQTCSLGVFPESPEPFFDDVDDGDDVGDFQGGSTAQLTIRGARIYCQPAAGTNVLEIPYTLVFDNQAAPGATAANVTAATNAKCVQTTAAQVAGVVVQGWVELRLQTDPSGDPQAFSFTAPGASPSSFSLAAGGSRRVELPLSPTGTRTLAIDEALVPGWVPGAAIACTSPSGGPAPYVAVDGAARRISAALDVANYGAVCTITNTKLAQVTVRAQSVGGAGPFSLGFGTNGLPGVLTLDTRVQNPASAGPFVVAANGADASIAVQIPAGATLSSGSCTDGVASFGTLAGSRLTVAGADVRPGRDITCTFVLATPTPPPNLLLVKSADAAAAAPGTVVTYTLVVQNSGPGDATAVVVSEPLSPYLGWGVGSYGPGLSFQFTDGSPASGLAPGTPEYSADGGATWTLAPVSGGGGAPAGFDGRVTAWRLPLTGTMAAGRQFTLSFRTVVK